jgi:hypothetical protein
MAKMSDEGPFAFPIETILYWERLEGMSLEASFLVQIKRLFGALLETIEADLESIDYNRDKLNCTYRFKDGSMLDEMDIEVPDFHELDEETIKSLLEGEEPTKSGGKDVH